MVAVLTVNRYSACEKSVEDNFFTMSETTRSHGGLLVPEELGHPICVKYYPYTKKAFLTNVDYYG